ncbi:MAG: isoprenylcysteine carboxylmethyltransferase family protein [Deltaproteobacteria bacterium]|nr:isoprenylcysteine carboxylmethyltransferase family protein [Deltaproteobacteria bacterium]MBW1921720.1 isoprenylcysteine carboxylmethyltransferase family protein [Deltaproteobacteria bacterium]MBW1934928.1 isoprenylcysteine carboxylmethyltransferase family protein [Deltaproteobacteria bacterium]MBW1977184.1 isoprenylcysteine carboxylmethyltransferase family protein [Deltaproteobacteria bacterium]MBW2046108.1 isoprenylcysteine carboxylmethyltransferase family protein [Deltaproteobacteria bact
MISAGVARIHKIFNNKALRSFLVKLRYPIVLVLFVLFIPHIKRSFFLPAFVVSMFGEAIQVWSFGSLDKNRSLAAEGLYALTRNPMYIGRYFLVLGFLLLMGNVWVVVAFSVLYYFYMVNRVGREEKKLEEIFGHEYDEYCSMVNRFIPSLRGSQLKSLLFFRKKFFLQNHGHWNLLGVLCCYLVFFVFAFFILPPK